MAHLSPGASMRYTKVLTSFALLRATYDKFVGTLNAEEALGWPLFDEWLQERVDNLRVDRGGESI